MTAPDNTGENSFVLLQVGERRFALPADIVAELAPPVRLHAFPHTSPLVAGVILRRGHIVPVYDVGPVLAGRSFSAHRFYLVARRTFGAAHELSAIPVNGECELASGRILPPQPAARTVSWASSKSARKPWRCSISKSSSRRAQRKHQRSLRREEAHSMSTPASLPRILLIDSNVYFAEATRATLYASTVLRS